MNYQNSEEWKKFREDVIRLDEYKCCICSKSTSDGVTLHAHHTDYIQGHKPWEYPYDMCQTLCAGCHAIEHGKIPPKVGWEYIGCDDLGGQYGTCDYCGTQMRYSHLINHKDWRPIEVGQDCCDRLTASDEATEAQRIMHALQERRKRFVSSPRWVNNYGSYKIQWESCLITVIPEESVYALKINSVKGNEQYSSLTEAKIKAFDVIVSGVFADYIRKKYQRRNS